MQLNFLPSALLVACCLSSCMTLYGVAEGPTPDTSFVLAGKSPLPMGRVSLCRAGKCGEIFTFEQVDGLRINSIATAADGHGLWVLAGSPLMYRGKVYYCSRRGNCILTNDFPALEAAEGNHVSVESLEDRLDDILEKGHSRRDREEYEESRSKPASRKKVSEDSHDDPPIEERERQPERKGTYFEVDDSFEEPEAPSLSKRRSEDRQRREDEAENRRKREAEARIQARVEAEAETEARKRALRSGQLPSALQAVVDRFSSSLDHNRLEECMLLANGLLNRLTGAGFDEAEMKQLLDGPLIRQRCIDE